MLIVVSTLISFFLLPNELIEYAKSVIAAATSTSNFYFWQHSAYFDSPMSNPLLHTWSLAVEEQFYILFPVFLVITRRLFPQQLKHGVVILFLTSLVASEWALHFNATTAFYMPYTRAWELLLGTIISLGFFPRLRMPLMRNALTLLGIGMIAYSAFRYSERTPFPGLAAMVPCIGSALIIGVGESGSSFVGRMLSLRPIVFVGLISYSLYLWHWPIIILDSMGLSPNFNAIVSHRWAFLLLSQTSNKAMEVLISFGLAILSWRFVERPFRSYPLRIKSRPLFALSGAITAALLLFSGVVIHAHGFERRFPARAVQVASFLSPPGASSLGQLGDCVINMENRTTVFNDNHCLETASGKETYLLLGDSHAGSLWNGLKNALPDSNVPLAAVWGCRPSIHSEDGPLCKQMMDFIFQKYLPSHPTQGLLLEARWYSKSLKGIGEIVVWAKTHGIPVIVFGPVAEYDAPLPRLLAYSIAWNRPNLAQQHRVAYSPVMDAQMQNLAENTWHVLYVSLYQATCKNDYCLEYADEKNGVPLLNDADHLSEGGSKLLVNRLSGLGELDSLKYKSHPGSRRLS